MQSILVFFLSTLLFVMSIKLFSSNKQMVKRRVEQLVDRNGIMTESEPNLNKNKKRPAVHRLIQWGAKNIRTSETNREKIEQALESSDIPLKVEEFITIRVGLFFIFLLIPILLGHHFILAILIGFIGWKLPSYFVKRRKEKRITAGSAQLPQVLEIMSSAMKSGFSFLQAMQQVAKEIPEPIGLEFMRTLKEINYGVQMDTAFQNLLRRLPNKDLEIILTAILIQRTTGGNLSQILETIHETIAERVRMKDELKALTSQGRISALVITLLPVGLGLILSVMNPEYFTPMLEHPIGWALIGGGIISGIIGWIVIQKIVTIEV